jgi:M6 family metalloprotease-like protein
MNKSFFVIIFLCLGLGSLSAQSFNHKIEAFPSSVKSNLTQGTLRILAVMVNFPVDKDEATDGNGTFGSIYSQNYGNNIIDPLPHDKTYFEEHLLFVKNYFSKVSNGKLDIEYTVLPSIITVSKMMRNYSPPSNSDDFTLLANLSKEVWAKADSANPGFDFKDYDLFVIFHAGVGRDVSLPGSINDSKDLPSIYFNYNSFVKIYGNTFTGFPVSNNSFDIKNSLIMPETESREQSTYGGTVLYQLTINGLLAASVGSYLGLPDLYNTQTGFSAIGRFGLMDPQSIFAYNGAFPPEPSAWEKIYLGWATPVTIQPGNYSVDLTANLVASPSDTVILKVPINSSEYFLIENRQRDALNNGSIITYYVNGNQYTQTFLKDQTGFTSIDTDSLKGVISNVDEFDWALPGLIDDTSSYKGGILIWHIDQNVIDTTLADDRVNANSVRGVNLMEASGVPEIGQQFTDLLGNQVIGEGSYLDYWYSGNQATLYKNIFSDYTRPNSKSNSGANSLITISNFSAIGNKMSFKISYGDSLIKPLFAKQIQLVQGNNKLNVSSSASGINYNVISNSALMVYDKNGNFLKSIYNFSNYKPASISFNNNYFTFGTFDSTLNFYSSNGTTDFNSSLNIGDEITAPPVIYNQTGQPPTLLVGTRKGKVIGYVLGNNFNIAPVLSANFNLSIPNLSIEKITVNGDYYSFIGSSNNQFTVLDNKGNSFSDNGDVLDFASTSDNKGNYINVILTTGNHFKLISSGKLLREFTINSVNNITSFSLADLKQDGNNYILFTNGNRLDAVNLQGAEATNFPFLDPQSIGFISTPLAADISGDQKSEVIAATSDGRIFAVDGSSANIVDGFPISTGSQLASVPVLFNDSSEVFLASINTQNNFEAWKVSSSQGKVFWSEEDGNSFNQASVGAAVSANVINEFFPASKAYNYPNPVYGNVTYIHYYVSQDSKINIKIFDLAGDFVAELNDNAQGGYEKETPWYVNNIQSGVYLARIQAQSNGGITESNIIKIAVIK